MSSQHSLIPLYKSGPGSGQHVQLLPIPEREMTGDASFRRKSAAASPQPSGRHPGDAGSEAGYDLFIGFRHALLMTCYRIIQQHTLGIS